MIKGIGILSKNELIAKILEIACKFIEFYTEDFFIDLDLNGYHLSSPPKRQHLGIADKLILRKLIEKNVEEIPENFRTMHNVHSFAYRILYGSYYPEFHGSLE